MPSLKRTRSESEMNAEVKPDPVYFPHQLYLDEKDIKLLKVAKLKLGDERAFSGMVRVTSTSENKDENSGDRRSMTLTLIEGYVEGLKSNEERGSKIYGEKEEP